jgi:NAD(P)-dependent dehydrogenase (short-subunit alcohol dehydrogenase family)
MALHDGIAGRAFLVTAGASGIGRACAENIVAAGGHVAIADIDADAARATADGFTAAGGKAIAITTDVRSRGQLEAAVSETERVLGRLRGVVAAAGVSIPEPAHQATRAAWDTVIDVSLTGCFLTCQIAGRRLIANGGGAIVTISSIDAFGAHAGRVAYCAAKFAMIGMVRTLALEWGRHGIRVNTVAPGITDTAGVRRGIPPEQIRNVSVDRTPLGRIAEPDDVGRAVGFLLSDAAAYVSGAVLPVDGGLTAGYITRWNGGDYASKRMLAQGEYGPPEYAAPEPGPGR